MYVDLVLRWIHILSAITLVGGTIFIRFAYFSEETSEEQKQFGIAVRRRWSKLVGAASGLLLISGLFNLIRILGRYDISGESFPESAYHMVLGIKFLLAFVVFFLSAALAGKRKLAERLRQNEKMWLTVNVALAVTVVCLAGIMKLADRTPKPDEAASGSVHIKSPARL